MSITVTQNNSTDKSLNYHCFPLEYIYKVDPVTLKADIDIFSNKYPNVKDTKTDVNSKWVFVRCAYSVDLNQMYINSNASVSIPVPQFYDQYTYGFEQHYKKFYNYFDRNYGASLKINNIGLMNTQVYIRNLNVYREYIPNTVNYPNYL